MATPTIPRRGSAVSATSNNAAWTPSWSFSPNTAIAAGEEILWIVIISSDGANVTLSETGGNGWTKSPEASDAAQVTQGIWTKRTNTAFAAGAAPGFVLGASAAEQYTGVILGYKAPTLGNTPEFLISSAATGSSTNSNPPAVSNTTGVSIDALVVATRSGDSTVVPSAAPTNYTNVANIAAGGTAGASTTVAERSITIAAAGSEDPGVFTVASEQWVSRTLAVYEKPPVLGPELLTNGGFDSNASGWTKAGVDGTLVSSGGKGVVTVTNAYVQWYQAISTTPGTVYTVSGSIDGVTGSPVFYGVRKMDDVGTEANTVDLKTSSTGAFFATFTATASTSYIVIQLNTTGATMTVDNLSAKGPAVEAVYIGAAGKAQRYLGSLTDTQRYIGAKSLW